MTREEAIDRLRKISEKTPIRTNGDDLLAITMAIQALSQEPTIGQLFSCEEVEELRSKIWKQVEQEQCDDAISREMALKECHDIVVDGERYRIIQEETLLGLPSVTQKSKTGHWIKRKNVSCLDNVRWKYECSECGYEVREKHDYCVCGADMRGAE